MSDALDRVKAIIAASEREDWLTVQEYADRCRIHVQTVYAAIKENRIPFQVVRVDGHSIRIIVPRGDIPGLKRAECNPPKT